MLYAKFILNLQWFSVLSEPEELGPEKVWNSWGENHSGQEGSWQVSLSIAHLPGAAGLA